MSPPDARRRPAWDPDGAQNSRKTSVDSDSTRAVATTETTSYVGKLADPAWHTERARKAALASHSTDNLIRRVIERADELTDEQVDTLRRALPPVEAGRG